MLSGPVLILKSFSFYSDTVANILKSQLQGLAHVFDWRRDAKGDPESFYKNLWEKSKDRYLAVVVLGEEALNFAIKNIREKPVIFIYSYPPPRYPTSSGKLYGYFWRHLPEPAFGKVPLRL